MTNAITNVTTSVGVASKATNQYQNDNTMLNFAAIVSLIGLLGILIITRIEARTRLRKAKEVEELRKVEQARNLVKQTQDMIDSMGNNPYR